MIYFYGRISERFLKKKGVMVSTFFWNLGHFKEFKTTNVLFGPSLFLFLFPFFLVPNKFIKAAGARCCPVLENNAINREYTFM